MLVSHMTYFAVVMGSSSIVAVMNLLVQTHTHIKLHRIQLAVM